MARLSIAGWIDIPVFRLSGYNQANLKGCRLPFNKIPMKVGLTKYLYVLRQIMEVTAIAMKNLTSIGIWKLNIKNVINVTMGKWIKYIQYAPSEINLNFAL